MSRPVVVSDAGPLIALAGCGHLELLVAVFDAVHVPQAVLAETTADRSRPGAADIAAFVEAHVQVHPDRHDPVYTTAASHLDEGEAQALSQAHRQARTHRPRAGSNAGQRLSRLAGSRRRGLEARGRIIQPPDAVACPAACRIVSIASAECA